MITTGSDEFGEELAARTAAFIIDADATSPRSLQRRIGPSEIGDPCDRRLAYKLMDWPATASSDRDPIAAIIGTGFHMWMADQFAARQTLLPDGRPRYRIEERVHVLDGATEAASISGSTDLFDRLTGIVYDWKLVGHTVLDKYKREGPGNRYRIQGHLYGLGQERAGETVTRVAVVFIARHHELRVHVWSEPYDRQVAFDALARLGGIREELVHLDPEQHPEHWAQFSVLDTPGGCRYCDWFTPGSTDLAAGCPGVVAERPTGFEDLVA